MIKFFRKIRQKLLAVNSVRKYLIYAIGEIVLVVIGILIALQINNWNEWTREREKEKEILIALADNLDNNVQTMEFDIAVLKKFRTSARIILSILDNKMPYADSLDLHFHQARVAKHALILSQSGYEQYKNTGFHILQNERLKKEVLTLFESTYPKALGSRGMINNEYVPFTDHYVPLFIYTSDGMDNHYLKPINFNELYDDKYYIGWLRAYMEGRYTLTNLETDLMNETKRVLQLIKDELK